MRYYTTACDLCARPPMEDEVQTYHLLDQRGRRVSIDLCTEHRDQLLTPLWAVLRKAGVHEKSDERKGGKASGGNHYLTQIVPTDVCPFCGATVSTSIKTMRDHLRRHKKTISEAFPEANPTPFPCVDCGRAFSSPQGLSRHRAHRHPAEEPVLGVVLPEKTKKKKNRVA
jgi:hypothetical protein